MNQNPGDDKLNTLMGFSATLSGIAVALAAIIQTRTPLSDHDKWVSVVLLVGGLLSLLACSDAFGTTWDQRPDGLTRIHVFAYFGIIVIVIGYSWLLMRAFTL